MSRAASVIEINGTSYDANSGNVLGAARRTAAAVRHQTKVIDGFVRQSSNSLIAQKSKIHSRRVAKTDRQPKTAKQVHSRTQRSRTLIRSSVRHKKPSPAEKPANSLATFKHADKERFSRAAAVPKSSHVKKFGMPAMKPRPTKTQVKAHARPLSVATSHNATMAAPLPSMVASASHARLEKMLDSALTRADSHLYKSSKKVGRFPRWILALITILVLLLIFSAIAMRDIPQVAIRVAGQRAHISASLPGYTPDGFAFSGPVQHGNHNVTLRYNSQTGPNLNYSLTEKASDWDSSSLASNMLGPKDQVQTSSIAGTTVYIYGSTNNATWVNNGIWYNLKDQAHLSVDQILRIVQSM